jgi:hypothetical protein
MTPHLIGESTIQIDPVLTHGIFAIFGFAYAVNVGDIHHSFPAISYSLRTLEKSRYRLGTLLDETAFAFYYYLFSSKIADGHRLLPRRYTRHRGTAVTAAMGATFESARASPFLPKPDLLSTKGAPTRPSPAELHE